MNHFTCPHCQTLFGVTPEYNKNYCFNFDKCVEGNYSYTDIEDTFAVHIIRCPCCYKETVLVNGISEDNSHINVPIFPRSLALCFPDYIPESIREDYEEAYAIMHLSPKASATLSRRCLQGIIRDFWGISDNNLFSAINELKETIDPRLWQAIDGLRKIGNIGAHMEKDVNAIIPVSAEEAEYLVKLIEVLIKITYVEKNSREQLYNEIIQISREKSNFKKG